MTLSFVVIVIALFLLSSAAFAGVRAAPWLPTRQKDVVRMLRLAKVQPGELLLDLGAGDGRFLLEAVEKHAARARGFEISLLPYLAATWRLRRIPKAKAQMLLRDFFRQPLQDADVIACFLTPKAMEKLEQKWLKEARSGSRLVSYAFPFLNYQPRIVDKPRPDLGTVYLYYR